MFSKLMIASTAYLTANGLKVSNRHQSRAGINTSQSEWCGYNIKRWQSKHETQDFAQFSGGATGYEDPDFLANGEALYWETNLRGEEMKATYDKKVSGWARPSELVKSPSLWGSKGVQPAGTNQGQLGDCWFLASASALAENPERIKKIFTNQKYDSAGIFQVNFYHEGSPIKITVDDRIPYSEGTDPRYTNFGVKTPVNSKMSNNGAWWVVILEKAYAKYNVNYAQLNGGFTGVSLRELTGMPVQDYKVKAQTASDLFNAINQADQNNWVMTAGCNVAVDSLVPGHAYTILGAYDLQGGPKVLKMRNPWGSETYAGAYRDDDPAWTDAQKAQVGLTVADDGIFFLPVSNFVKAFDTYSVLMYQDWNVDTMKVTGTGQKFHKTFTSPVDQEVIITLEYQNERQIEAGCPRDDVHFNMYIDGGDPISVSKQMSYGITKVQATAGKAHKLTIYNWGDVTVNSQYVLQTFAAQGKVILG